MSSNTSNEKLIALETTNSITGQGISVQCHHYLIQLFVCLFVCLSACPIVYCEPWWDGIYQWPLSLANTTIAIPCHEIFALNMGNIEQKLADDEYGAHRYYARRKCLYNGEWGWNNWTNYTECLNLLALQVSDSSLKCFFHKHFPSTPPQKKHHRTGKKPL